MQRETKLGLLVGLGIILAIGIVVSDYMSVANRQTPPIMQQTAGGNGYDLQDGGMNGSQSLNGSQQQRMTPIGTENELRRQQQAEQTPRQTDDRMRQPAGEQDAHPMRVAQVDQAHRPAGGGTFHYVQEDETLWSIAVERYGDGRMLTLIEAANEGRILPDGRVRRGVQLVIPPLPGDSRHTERSDTSQREQHDEADRVRHIDDLLPGPGRQRDRGVEANGALAAATITVEEGDTLSSLAGRHLGDQNRYMELYRANRDVLPNPNMVRPGMVLKLPVDVARRESAIPNRAVAIDRDEPRSGANSAFYVVRPGDTLSRIAASKLGDESRWYELWQHNKSVVPDANNLQPGTKIRIP